MNTPIAKLIEYFGNQTNTATQLNAAAIRLYGDKATAFTRQVVNNWQHRGYIPWRHGELVQAATKGEIKARDVWQAAATARHHEQ